MVSYFGGLKSVTELFRKEALESKSTSHLGSARLITPVTAKFWALYSTTILVFIITFILFAEYNIKVSVEGVLFPQTGLITIQSPSNGTVEKIFVKLNQELVKGDSILLINEDKFFDNKRTLSELFISERNVALEEIESSHNNEISISEIELENLKRQVDLSRKERDVVEKKKSYLVEVERRISERLLRYNQNSKFIPRTTIDAVQSQLDRARIDLFDLELYILELKKNENSNTQRIKELEFDQQVFTLQRETKTKLTEQKYIERMSSLTTEINANQKGTITSILANPGDSVTIGTPLVMVANASDALNAHLLIPSSGIGKMMIGDSVQLRLHSFPHMQYGTFEGLVSEISSSAISSSKLSDLYALATNGEPMFVVKASLDSAQIKKLLEDNSVRPGMVVSADIIVSKVKIYEILFSRLFSN
tara:strand:+ start:38 stop:1303 length:1266 start_codon:yes stop_codon:yes gene_type:complete